MSADTRPRRKFTAVVSFVVEPFENVRSGFNTITINYRQRHTYTLECGHKVSEESPVGSQAKGRLVCKRCAGGAS
jgi:hypothetical protein